MKLFIKVVGVLVEELVIHSFSQGVLRIVSLYYHRYKSKTIRKTVVSIHHSRFTIHLSRSPRPPHSNNRGR
jgi:hypothetical protein